MKNTILLVVLALLVVATPKDNPIYDQLFQNTSPQSIETNRQLMQEEKIFRQVVNHFDYGSEDYFDQRYWVVKDYFSPSVGPVFLYICGQNTCTGVPESRTWVVDLARQLKGLVLVLEHRFYGKSLPFGSATFLDEHMSYLSSEMALRDLAYFIDQIKEQGLYGVTNNPWITVGGSYPGALSAYFRYKYPHLVIGSLASSAVILAKADLPEFDEQIYSSSQKSGDFCSQALNNSNSQVEKILDSGQSEAANFKKKFEGGELLSNTEFLFFWADAIVLTIQYGGRQRLCGLLKDKTSEEQFDNIVKNAQSFPVYEYGSYYLRNATKTYQEMRADRPWYYQECTEFGLFQTFSQKHPMRSKRLDLAFFEKFCKDAFGEQAWGKFKKREVQYGGLSLRSDKIIFSNGVEDPWRWGSLQQPVADRFVIQVIDCINCAHCVDLYTPKTSDEDSLKKARNIQVATITTWVTDYWREVRRSELQNVLLKQQIQ